MGRVRKFAAFGFALALMIGALSSPAGAEQWVKKQLRWTGAAGTSAPIDTTFLESEVDTVRTEVVNTSDWDWSAAANDSIPIFFEAQLTDAQADTINFTVEKQGGFSGIFTPNRTIVSAFGACAVRVPDVTHNKVYSGVLIVKRADTSANNLWGAPGWRLRVAGDVTGTSPALQGLRCWIVYPKRSFGD